MFTQKRNRRIPPGWGMNVNPDGRSKWNAQGINYLSNGLEDRDVPRVDVEGKDANDALSKLVAELWQLERADLTTLEQFEVEWSENTAWVIKTLNKEQECLKDGLEDADTLIPIWVQYSAGQVYIHMHAKPVQLGRYGLWAGAALTHLSETPALVDYLARQIAKQIVGK